MADSNSSPEQRVTDAEREHTIHLLKRHTGMGRLTLEEFSDRAGMAWAARTKGDLEELVRDLPDDHLPSRGAQPDRRWTVAVMGNARRRGRWRVASRTNVVAVMGECQLDLGAAEFSGEDITVNAGAVMGSIDIVVPEGIEVELSGIPVMGTKELRIRDVPRVPGSPRVRVRALPLMGSVTVRSKRSGRTG